MNIALTVVVMLVSFGLAANSILREKTGRTWDLLILTRVRSGRLIVGKWLASLWALNGDHAVIALLRIGLLCFVLTLLPAVPGSDFMPTRRDVLILIGLVTAFTALDAMMNTVCAMASVLLDMTMSVALILFGLVRVLCLTYGLGWMVLTVTHLVTPSDVPYLVIGVGGLVAYGGLLLAMLAVSRWIAIRRALISG
jgi:hypothetical protein